MLSRSSLFSLRAICDLGLFPVELINGGRLRLFFRGDGKKKKTKIKRIMIVSALGWYLPSMGAADENKIKDWKLVAFRFSALLINTFYTRCIASDDPRLQ